MLKKLHFKRAESPRTPSAPHPGSPHCHVGRSRPVLLHTPEFPKKLPSVDDRGCGMLLGKAQICSTTATFYVLCSSRRVRAGVAPCLGTQASLFQSTGPARCLQLLGS